MSELDLRETWPAFLAALETGDEKAMLAAFDDQQRAFAAAVLALDAEALASNIDPAYELHNHTAFFDWPDQRRRRRIRVRRRADRAVRRPPGHARADARVRAHVPDCAEFPWAQVWTLRDQAILRVDVFSEHDRALAAAERPS